MKSEVALSTTAAEYIALSPSTRNIIPIHGILNELSSATPLIVGYTTTFSIIFEDNKGGVQLVNSPKMRPRTCHLALKYHHFRSHVANGSICIHWIDTKHYLVEYFY